MDTQKRNSRRDAPPPVFIVSGGVGASGAQLVQTALAQFEATDVPVITIPGVKGQAQIEAVVQEAAASGGTIVHTLVDPELRRVLTQRTRAQGVVAIDLMGQMLDRLTRVLGREPVGQPGLYRQLRREYLDRIEAIEYTVEHDDGRNLHGLRQAEIVLIGASRLGKTPLSIYLGMRGWMVANIPIVPGVSPPEELFDAPQDRVVGLVIDPGQLYQHRRARCSRMGMDSRTDYTDVSALQKEIASVRRLCRRHGFSILDVTNKPIEESAFEVIGLVTQQTI